MDSDYFYKSGDELHVDLWYPRIDYRPKAVVVGLVDVRAADQNGKKWCLSRHGVV